MLCGSAQPLGLLTLHPAKRLVPGLSSSPHVSTHTCIHVHTTVCVHMSIFSLSLALLEYSQAEFVPWPLRGAM